jgi:hypothetical protein
MLQNGVQLVQIKKLTCCNIFQNKMIEYVTSIYLKSLFAAFPKMSETFIIPGKRKNS